MEFGPNLILALIEGSVQAAVLTLTAVGLSLVFGVMRVVNVAHGEFFMLGAVLAWAIASEINPFHVGSLLIPLTTVCCMQTLKQLMGCV